MVAQTKRFWKTFSGVPTKVFGILGVIRTTIHLQRVIQPLHNVIVGFRPSEMLYPAYRFYIYTYLYFD